MSDYEDVSDSLYEYQPFSQKEYENYSFTETSTNSSNIDNSKGKQKKKKVENNTSGGFGNGDSEKTTPTNNDMNKEDLRSMALELAKREAELERREMDLANREQDEIPLIIKSDRNWPRCYPIIDHSYDKIPTRFKKAIAWTGYIIWYLYSATLLFNIICSLLVLFIGPVLTGESLFNKIRYVFFSLIVFIVGVPAHFVLSYWPLYKVMQYGTLPRYILFFAGYAIPIIVTLFALVGYYDYGFGGIYVLITYWPSVIDREKPDYSVFTPMIILICFWILHIVLFVMMYLVVIFTFRKQKHTLKDVQDLAKESTRDAVSAVTSTIGQVAVESALGRR